MDTAFLTPCPGPFCRIVRHTLVAEDGKVIGGKTFQPTDAEARSEYSLPAGFKGKLYATSFCNKHDLWISELSV